ncbi:uncharacterized protein VTP21DRAFT_3042 [Calcarisporiella thermophila]|uniref:uncharacterized protein n=1 Tax=Calcarisporiella thermophila TaxID=911321 RepID=UPI003744AF66
MGSRNIDDRHLNKELRIYEQDDSIKLPKKGERNILITSALPYVNNTPHLGNIIGSVLSADVFARYSRLRGYNTLYICGTDEYGTATETKALEEGLSCQELCDKYNAIHRECYEWFMISFDHFGRTTTPQQTEIAQDMFLKLHKNGYTLEESVVQLFCEKCQRFLADRYVEGTCPKCGYEDARGDQCDKCGNLLNSIELINPRCKLDGNTPITRESTHLFLDLAKLQPACERFFEETATDGKWTANAKAITQAWLKDGLKPRCITRDLKWGVPVPLPEMKDKVFYVWFDAPIGYPSITANYTPEWEKWWKNPEDVTLYQFMGKDNVPFHTVMFPCTQLGTGDDWTILSHISTTEYLNYETGKFSKSRGVGVFGNNAKDTGVPSSVWRYHLLSNRPESNDSQFTWRDFISRNNNELLANLGNFCSRVIKFVVAKFDSVIPEFQLTSAEEPVVQEINDLLANYIEDMEQLRLRAALQTAMKISARGNLFLQDNKLSNALLEEPERCASVVGLAINIIYLLSALVSPYMPTTTEAILRQLNAPARLIPDRWTGDDILGGHRIGKPEYLFTRIDSKMEEQWKSIYGGEQKEEKKDKKKSKKEKKEKKSVKPEEVKSKDESKVNGADQTN